MKIGFSVLKKPVEECFEYAAKNKFTNLEIDLYNKYNFLDSFTGKRINAVKSLAKKYKIELSLHLPYTLNLAEKVAMIRKANIDYAIKAIKLAKKLGAKFIVMHTGYLVYPRKEDIDKKTSLKNLIYSIKIILRYCKRYNMAIALENSGRNEGGLFKTGVSVDDFRFILENTKSKYVNMCLDVGHANLVEGAEAYIEEFSKKIISLHVHDNKGKRDEHAQIGKGSIKWKSLFEKMKQKNFNGVIIFEIFDDNLAESKKILEKLYIQ